MSDVLSLAIGGGVALSLVGLAFVGWWLWRQRQKLNAPATPAAGAASAPPVAPPLAGPRSAAKAAPGPDRIGPTEDLIDVLGLVGNAVVLKNGTFIRMLEVWPVDLERGDPSIRERFWTRFADALRRIQAPLGVQVVITTRPQDITPYLIRWEDQAHDWRRRAEASDDPNAHDRRMRMMTAAVETGAFLVAAHERLLPMQQRYLVVVSHNPFPEAQTNKPQKHVLSQKIVGEALDKLQENVDVATAALSTLNLPIESLDPAAMCQALWEHYHHPPNILGAVFSPQVMLEEYGQTRRPGVNGHGANGAGGPGEEFFSAAGYLRQRPRPEEFLSAAQDPERLADLLAPALLDEQPAYMRVGDVVGRGYTLYDFDVQSQVDLSALLSFSADMTHALYLSPADPVAIRRQLKEKETELKSGQIVDARRGAVTDWARQAQVQSLEAQRAEVEIALQAPYFLHWFCLIWANDLLSLEKKCQQFETRLKVMGIRFYRANRTQVGVLQSTRPLARMSYRLKPRNMTADSLGPFFPFSRREYFDPEGWHFGVHRGNGMFVCLNPFQGGSSNASELVLGTPGGGKSVYMKQAIETLLALGHRVFVLDPEREYLRLAVDFHAPYIDLGRRRDVQRLGLEPADPEAWTQGLIDVGELYESLAATSLTADPAGTDALARCYGAVMQAAGILLDRPETWGQPAPALAALVERLSADPAGREIGRVLAYSAGALAGGHQINIMDINLSSEEPWVAAAQSLAAFIEAVLARQLQSAEFNALVRCYQSTMRRYGLKEEDPSTWNVRAPTLSALADTLASDDSRESLELAKVLEQYAYGIYAGMFNHETTVDLAGAQLAAFGMRSLRENVEKSLAPVFAWQVLRLVWNEVVAAGAAYPTHLFIDEAWYVLEQPGAAVRLERMARSFRKHFAALHLATQEIDRLVESPEAAAIANVCGLALLFGQETESAVRGLAQVFQLSETEQDDVLRANKGEALLVAGSRIRIPIYVAVNPMRLARLSTNVEQQQAVARASRRRAVPVW